MRWQHGLSYGLMGLPLAFVALPLYVILPNFYAKEFGVSLTALGAVLLITRLFDALIDPLLGRWSDRLYQQSTGAVLRFAAVACVLLGIGFYALFIPMALSPHGLLLWCAVFLMLTYAAFSAVTVAHQSWGALLGGGDIRQGFVVAWREGLGLLGVVLASIAPTLWGMPVTVALFWLALSLGYLAWMRSDRPPGHPVSTQAPPAGILWLPFKRPAFRRLLGVFILNGIASAVPATLVLFFIQDRLMASKSMEPVFLGTFFLCAALSMPLWVKGVARLGLAQAWLLGMGISVLVFIWATQLQAGDNMPYLVIVVFSGLALGADLALPGAMLARVIANAGDLGRAQGAYFGWWNFATKLNLALAAGLALPILGLFGYQTGARSPQALQALTVAYCVLPCILKCMAGLCLYFFIIRPSSKTQLTPTP
jgi:glycoside/pentoside/hexuronide:cation symporter, GPH family